MHISGGSITQLL